MNFCFCYVFMFLSLYSLLLWGTCVLLTVSCSECIKHQIISNLKCLKLTTECKPSPLTVFPISVNVTTIWLLRPKTWMCSLIYIPSFTRINQGIVLICFHLFPPPLFPFLFMPLLSLTFIVSWLRVNESFLFFRLPLQEVLTLRRVILSISHLLLKSPF